MPKYEIAFVTRCCNRPKMLSENIASIQKSINARKKISTAKVQQIFLVDDKRRGIHFANKALVRAIPHIDSDWVYILDDDCWLVDHKFLLSPVFLLPHYKDEYDIVFYKSKRPPGPPSGTSIMPTREVWTERVPKHGHTNCLCYLVKAELWKKHIDKFGASAGGDWTFLKALMGANPKTVWINKIVAEARQLGRGKLFEGGSSLPVLNDRKFYVVRL